MATNIVATRYELRDRIGAGGVAVVYRAFDRRLERDVALKVLRSEYAQDQEFLARFEREARTAAGLNHPNIVRVDDYGAYGETFFIAMELVEGSNLKEHVRVRGPLPTAEAVRVTRELLSALAAAHARGLVHRDVKPQNVLIDRSGAAKLTDFGIARLPSSTQLTQLGTTIGTAAYVAPEQAEGSVVGPAADLYGVGLLLYEMLTGRAPFEGDSPAAVLYRQVHEPPRPPRELNPAVPPALERVVLRALEKAPGRRWTSAEEMARSLDEAMTEPAPVMAAPAAMANTVAFPAVAAPVPTAPVAAAPRREWGLWLPLGLVGLGLALGVAWLVFGRSQGSRAAVATPVVVAETPAAVAVPPAGVSAAPAAKAAFEPTAVPTAEPKPTAAPTKPAPSAAPAKPTAVPKPTQPPPTAVPQTAALRGAVTLEDTAFQGGYRNTGGSIYRQRTATWVYGAQSPYPAMSATFELPAAPDRPGRLVVVGLDSEDDPKTSISVSVNDVEIFAGPAPFENDTRDPDFENGAAPWREHAWTVPAEALRSGANTVVIRSLAPSANVGTPPFFMVDAARVEFGR